MFTQTRTGLSGILALCVGAGLAAPSLGLDGGHDHGGFTHPITTTSHQAQEHFDRGLLLAWGFNHIEAAREFRSATAEDPSCAMCWWGVALVLGPNINAALDPDRYPEILEAFGKAKALSDSVTEPEQAYINALATRYGPGPEADRSELDRAYAAAMRRVALAHPDDLTAATLFAEALMDTMPWDYWLAGGEPKAATREFIDVLETVLRRETQHAGANHLLIHALEKTRPRLGVPAAERLDKNPQATGHLVHMASHIYMRVGRYDDAARVNARAIEDDDAYARDHETPAEYFPYMLHNHHMRWAALGFEGRRAEAAAEARYLADNIPPGLMRDPKLAGLQHFYSIPWFDQVWFSDWKAILATPEPDEDLPYARAIWHYARGMALANTSEVGAAGRQLQALTALAVDPRIADMMVSINTGRAVLEIARELLGGTLAAASGDHPEAIRRLAEAVRREDALTYDEPPSFLMPSRQLLGVAQLAAGRPADAERTFRGDLEVFPGNGWSLRGLEQSLLDQKHRRAAKKVRKQLEAAWERSEVSETDTR